MESKLFRLKRIKTQIWRFFPLLFLFIAAILIILSITKNSIVHSAKQRSISFFEPVVSFVSEPIFWLKNGIDIAKNWSLAYHENAQLKAENEYLLKWRSLALELMEEEKELKQYLNYIPPQKTRSFVTKIVLKEGDAFSRSFVVSAGTEEGIVKGMLAFTGGGLFGRVVEVMPHYSRVIPMTDYLSRVPVWVGENRVPALLIGDNTSRPFLQFFKENEKIQEKDKIVTSGDVGVYPAGLIVGEVEEIYNEEARVLLYATGEGLLFVRLVDFGLGDILLKEEE